MKRLAVFMFDLLDRPGAFIFDVNIDTLERVVIALQAIIAIVIVACATQVIATPPPLFAGYILLLPPWLWGTLIAIGIAIQFRARCADSFYWRWFGALWALATSAALCGPLYLRTPLLALVLGLFGVPMIAVLAAMLKREIKRERIKQTLEQHLIKEHLSAK